MKPKVFKYNLFYENDISYVLEHCPYRQGTADWGIFGLGGRRCREECPHCVGADRENQIIKCDFRVLDLSLTYHWYDEIESGRKVIEYRALNDYWRKRLLECYDICKDVQLHKENPKYNLICQYCTFRFKPVHYDAVRFHRGQGGKQTMMYECARICIGYGHAVHGTTPDVPMFQIYLGKRLQ